MTDFFDAFKVARASAPHWKREGYPISKTYGMPDDGKGLAAYAKGKAAAMLKEEEDAAAAYDAARADLAAVVASGARKYDESRVAAEAANSKARARATRARAWRYGARGYHDGPARFLRFVGAVAPSDRRAPTWARNEGEEGYYTSPYGDVFQDGSGLCWGVVYQLPGRKGESRFVTGYQFGGIDDGPSLDLAHILTARIDWNATAKEAAEESNAPSHADSEAKKAAEEEREYQTAWQAGNRWADLGEEIAEARAAALAILAERKAARGAGSFPALCDAIRARVTDLCESIREARENRKELAAGDAEPLFFYPDEKAKGAFCEGAGVERFPA